MQKEIQAAEWIMIFVGLFLLIKGSEHLLVFNRIFQAYFFLFTFGISFWMAARYYKRYKKKNIVVFHIKEKEKLTNSLVIKSLQLLMIVSFGIAYYQEHWMYIPVLFSFFIFLFQLGKNGRPKIVFQHPNIYRDAIYFENLEPTSFSIGEDVVTIHGKSKTIEIDLDKLDETQFKREIEFEENQILDDVLLTENENEVIRTFKQEIIQLAEKLQLPIQIEQEVTSNA